jgi:hypothetical protein
MKRATVIVMLMFFALSVTMVGAQQEDDVKARDIKIHKKQLVTDDERKALDEIAKGKSSDRGVRSKVFQPLATGIVGEPIPSTGERYAIIVGLANYTGTVNDLCILSSKTDVLDASIFSMSDPRFYCQDYDSLHMRDTLIDQYGYDPLNITILRDGEATKANILLAMDALRSKLDGDDEVTFFYSGHGVSGTYYGMTDSEKTDEAIYTYDNNFLWDDELKQWANSLSSYRQAYIFDMCLAGGMNDIAGTNRSLAMSSLETQNSLTYTLGGGTYANGIAFSEGLFSHYFVVEGMINNLADKSNLLSTSDNQVVLEEAFSYAYPIVKAKQTPVLSDKYVNDFLLGN